MIPTATARMPRKISEVLSDLNMTGFLSSASCSPSAAGNYHF
jgi:hypothetical protein